MSEIEVSVDCSKLKANWKFTCTREREKKNFQGTEEENAIRAKCYSQ